MSETAFVLHPKVKALADFAVTLMDEAIAMRAGGATKATIDDHLWDRMVTYAHNRGMVASESGIPHWQLNRCPVCRDDGWVQTTRIVQGAAVEAYRRCSCKPVSGPHEGPFSSKAIEKVASGWSRGGKR